VLDRLEFGAATNSKDAVPLPVRLAVALLKDRDGVIDLNVPVSGTIDDLSDARSNGHRCCRLEHRFSRTGIASKNPAHKSRA